MQGGRAHRRCLLMTNHTWERRLASCCCTRVISSNRLCQWGGGGLGGRVGRVNQSGVHHPVGEYVGRWGFSVIHDPPTQL